METHTRPEPKKQAAYSPATTGPIIIATDGTAQSEAALSIARALARHLHADTQVLAVYQPFVMLVPEAQLLVDARATAVLRADLESRVRQQCAQLLGEPKAFGEVREGDPRRVISQVAAERGAQLVVMGLGRIEVVACLF